MGGMLQIMFRMSYASNEGKKRKDKNLMG